MNSPMQGHNHGGKNHLLAMLGIFAVILVVLLAAGRSFGEALPLAAVLACPVMMIGMMFMMRGDNGHQHGDDSTTGHDHDHGTRAASEGSVSDPATTSANHANAPTQRQHP
ncbi:DUF2933 domain-containing protein [Cellulomonas sp. P24]|jgi:hypothetical protein|uniref:DUF2933 domain-containing protein n=1 Tax=Cellulomonas sp. P24 TaxID=2885206 RepID=UPI00216B43F8|nr:DUF2933 domain-containing protein [Cellulomonas sp. P24]MCR6492082.1 DUF2933 domain-containing protein [Cellulomonas sp. P24]